MPSLEELLAVNNKLMEEHNGLIKQMIARAGGATAAAAKETKAAKGGAAGDELTAETLKPIVAAWLREFKADENDPENEARTDKFASALKNLGVEKIGEITKAADLERLKVWTAKQVAAGRITPLPSKDLDAPTDPNDI